MANIGFIQSELDLKLLVLYIMSRTAAPITFLQLLDLALCDAGVDYFSLTQAVDHMVATGQLTKEDDHYAITDKGRRNSEICESSLPYSVRMHCDENLVKVNEVLRREAQIRTAILDNTDGTCTLQLCLDDVTTPMLRVELLTANRTQAAQMADRFRVDPAALYRGITQLLTE